MRDDRTARTLGKLNDKPLVICDTGHNVAGWKFLSQQIEKQPCTHRHIVFGMVDDKDVSSVLELLPKTDTTYYWTQSLNKEGYTRGKAMQDGTGT